VETLYDGEQQGPLGRLRTMGARAAVVRCTAALVGIAIMGGACTEGTPGITRSRSGLGPATTAVAGVSLYPSPRIVYAACNRAQALTARIVLCPTRLPRPSLSSSSEPGLPPQPLGVVATDDPSLLPAGTGPGSVVLSFIYSAPYENDPSKNRPDRFLHFEVYVQGKCCGPPHAAEPAVLGGKKGLLVRAGGPGAYFYNHVRFFWNQDGVDYVATLHEFGAGTTALLGALVSGLEPVGPVAAPTRQMATPSKGDLTVPIPGMTGPVGVAVAGDTLWVASIGDAGAAYQTAAWPGRRTGPGLQRFDARTGRAEGRPIRLAGKELRRAGLIPRVDWRPSGLASGFGRVWTVVQVYPKGAWLFGLAGGTGQIISRFRMHVPLSRKGDVTSVAAVGPSLWVSLYGSVAPTHRGEFGGIFEPGSVWRIDPDTGAVVARIGVGAGVVSVAGTGNALWAANYRDDTVSRIDPSTNRVVATIPVGAGPTAIAATTGGVWVTNSLDGTVERIDPATNRVVARVAVGASPMGIAASPDRVWAADYLSDSVTVIDPRTNRAVATLPVGQGPIGIAEGAGQVWIANDLDSTLTLER
jgi:YVTN family beta-propeller protein